MTTTPTPDARTRVLDAAEAIAIRDGARRLTLDAAAQEAGVSKGGVLYHFPSKQALLDAMLTRTVAQMRARHDVYCEDARARGLSAPTLRGMIEVMRNMACDPQGVHAALVAAVAENPEMVAPVRTSFESLWQRVRAETGGHPTACVIVAAIEGLKFFNLFSISPFDETERETCIAGLEALADTLPRMEEPT